MQLRREDRAATDSRCSDSPPSAVGIVFLDRDNRKQAFESYKLAAKEVQRGRAIVVCPEGTRGDDYHLRPFKKGPFVLAIASQSPVIPTIVYGAREVMPKGSFVIRSGVVDLHFLEPIPTVGYDYDHRTELMTAAWSAMADDASVAVRRRDERDVPWRSAA